MDNAQLDFFINNGFIVLKCADLSKIDMSAYYNSLISSYKKDKDRGHNVNYDNEKSTYHKDLQDKNSLVNNLFFTLNNVGLYFLYSLDVHLNSSLSKLVGKNDESLLATNHYRSVLEDQPLLIPHTDAGLITILPKATNTGLQVRYNNEWIDLLPKEDEVVIIAGEMLNRFTEGKVKAPVHQVGWPKDGQDRYSTYFVFFPDSENNVSINVTRDGNINELL